MHYLKSDLAAQSASLSIIIIGKNEEINLNKVFSSVLTASEKYLHKYKTYPSIIYIDSASSDASVDIAKKYKIDYHVIEGKTNPAIARQTGMKLTKSEFIFFLDGDTEVQEKWLNEGVTYLLENTKYAGVGGILKFNIMKNNVLVWSSENYRNTKINGELITDGVGGTFLFRRYALDLIGGYVSNYHVSEEFEIQLKLAAIGLHIVRIVKPMGIHHDHKSIHGNFIGKYLLSSNIIVPGRIIRNAALNSATLSIIFKRYWPTIIQLPSMLVSLSFILKGYYLQAGAIIICLWLVGFYKKNWDLKRSVVSMFAMNFYSFGLYYGYFISKKITV